MLKLERTAQRHLNVIVYDRERFLNAPLLTAFAIAAAIHLILFLAFQITPLALRLNERDYPPMIVQADPVTPTGAAMVTAAAPTAHIRDNLPPRPVTTPSLSAIPAFASVRHIDDIKHSHTAANPFTSIEKDIYDVPIATKRPPSNQPAVEVIISGPLSTSTLVKNELPAMPLACATAQPAQRVVYAVVADEPSGKIVWLQRKESSQNSQLDKLAEKIILDMQFARHTGAFTIAGEIEIHFHHNLGGS